MCLCGCFWCGMLDIVGKWFILGLNWVGGLY